MLVIGGESWQNEGCQSEGIEKYCQARTLNICSRNMVIVKKYNF